MGAGVRAFIDPATGELTAHPTRAQLERFALQARSSSSSRSVVGLRPFELGRGGRGLNLQGRFQTALRVERGEDGNLYQTCGDPTHDGEPHSRRPRDQPANRRAGAVMRARAVAAVMSFALALGAAPAWSADVHGTLRLDPDVPVGADPVGRLRLYAPDPVDPGSSLSHWDLPATPDLLMEPFIAPGAPIGETDLSIEQLRDIGWMSGTSNLVVHIEDTPGEGFLVPGKSRRSTPRRDRARRRDLGWPDP